jgi:hypothetical protein
MKTIILNIGDILSLYGTDGNPVNTLFVEDIKDEGTPQITFKSIKPNGQPEKWTGQVTNQNPPTND